jgi:hypothetical protein
MSFMPNNSPQQIEEAEISLDLVTRAGLALLILAIIFSALGYFISPHDGDGKPVLLLPEVKRMESYQRSAQTWIENMQILDSQIATISANSRADLFSQSSQAQNALQLAVHLAQEIDRTEFPPSAVSLHEELVTVSLAYLEATRLLMKWVGDPEDGNLTALEEYLGNARQARERLEKSKWLEGY